MLMWMPLNHKQVRESEPRRLRLAVRGHVAYAAQPIPRSCMNVISIARSAIGMRISLASARRTISVICARVHGPPERRNSSGYMIANCSAAVPTVLGSVLEIRRSHGIVLHGRMWVGTRPSRRATLSHTSFALPCGARSAMVLEARTAARERWRSSMSADRIR